LGKESECRYRRTCIGADVATGAFDVRSVRAPAGGGATSAKWSTNGGDDGDDCEQEETIKQHVGVRRYAVTPHMVLYRKVFHVFDKNRQLLLFKKPPYYTYPQWRYHPKTPAAEISYKALDRVKKISSLPSSVMAKRAYSPFLRRWYFIAENVSSIGL
jgi:hypothetical protein